MGRYPPVEVRVQSMSGEETPVLVGPSATIAELRREVCAVRGLAYWQTRLVLDSAVLDKDSIRLCDAGVGPGTKLRLVVTSRTPEEFDAMYEPVGNWMNRFDGHLSLHHGFTKLPDEKKANLLYAIAADERIRRLTLARIGLRNKDAFILVAAMKHCTNLHVLNLSDNPLGDKAVSRLAEAFEKNPSVRELYLYNSSASVMGRCRLSQARASASLQSGRLPTLLCF